MHSLVMVLVLTKIWSLLSTRQLNLKQNAVVKVGAQTLICNVICPIEPQQLDMFTFKIMYL